MSWEEKSRVVKIYTDSQTAMMDKDKIYMTWLNHASGRPFGPCSSTAGALRLQEGLEDTPHALELGPGGGDVNLQMASGRLSS